MPLTAHPTSARYLVPQVVPEFQIIPNHFATAFGSGTLGPFGCTAKDQCITCHADTRDSYARFTQNVKFQIDVRSFDVYEDELDVSCMYDYLEVEGQRYCGTNGPQGVSPDQDSVLTWKPDWSVSQGLESSFKICAVSCQHYLWPVASDLACAAHKLHMHRRFRSDSPPHVVVCCRFYTMCTAPPTRLSRRWSRRGPGLRLTRHRVPITTKTASTGRASVGVETTRSTCSTTACPAAARATTKALVDVCACDQGSVYGDVVTTARTKKGRGEGGEGGGRVHRPRLQGTAIRVGARLA